MRGESTIEHASHRLCAALHMDGIDPAQIEITLPFDAWWRMWTRIEQLHRGMMRFDGRGYPPTKFQYAQSLNRAMNAVGWEMAGDIDQAAAAARRFE